MRLSKNIILIFSSEYDAVTKNVVNYIKSLSQFQVIRINDIEKLTLYKYHDHHIYFETNQTQFNSEEIKSIWYRRGYLYKRPSSTEKLIEYINIKEEYKLKQYLIETLSNKIFTVGNFIGEPQENKLLNLEIAQKVGLNIPKYIVGAGPLPEFDDKRYLVKTISNIDSISTKAANYSVNYSLFEKKLENIEGYSTFYLQQYINKLCDIRIFYLYGNFYSMAIFSQGNSKTRIDFRNYDSERPNRCIPCKLPNQIENKLRRFMNKLHLNTGSIDMVMTSDSKLWFLEVNPSGQFDWLNNHCNYNIEKHIANLLIS